MTVIQVYNLADEYASSLAGEPGVGYFRSAAKWFKAKGGTGEEYSVFIDMVFMWSKNHYDLLLSDAYCNHPKWEF